MAAASVRTRKRAAWYFQRVSASGALALFVAVHIGIIVLRGAWRPRAAPRSWTHTTATHGLRRVFYGGLRAGVRGIACRIGLLRIAEEWLRWRRPRRRQVAPRWRSRPCWPSWDCAPYAG